MSRPAAARPTPERHLVEIGAMLGGLRRNRWRIICGGLLGALLGVALVVTSPEEYESTAEVLVGAVPTAPAGAQATDPIADPVGEDAAEPRTLDTEAQLIRADAFSSRVGRRLGLPADELPDRFRISATPNTRLLQFTYTAESPSAARRGARVVAEEFITARTKAVARLLSDAAAQTVRTDIVREPRLPSKPKRTNNEVPVGSGLCGGLLLGLSWGAARDRWRPRITDAEQVAAASGLPVAATLGTPEQLRGLAFEVRFSGAAQVLMVGLSESELTTSVGSALRAGLRHLEDPPELEVSSNRPSSAYVLAAAQRADLVLIVVEAGRNTVAELTDDARLLSRTGRGTATVLVPRWLSARDVTRAAAPGSAAAAAGNRAPAGALEVHR